MNEEGQLAGFQSLRLILFCVQLYWLQSSGSGYPTLVIEIGQATREFSKQELLVFAEAIITQVQNALHEKFSDEPGCPEQMTVIARCQGASALKASFLTPAVEKAFVCPESVLCFCPQQSWCFRDVFGLMHFIS